MLKDPDNLYSCQMRNRWHGAPLESVTLEQVNVYQATFRDSLRAHVQGCWCRLLGAMMQARRTHKTGERHKLVQNTGVNKTNRMYGCCCYSLYGLLHLQTHAIH